MSDSIWFSVEEKLPYFTDFVWVKRSSEEEPRLAYYRIEKFIDALGVGDREGLSTDDWDDVTHWAELIEPPPPSAPGQEKENHV